MAGKERTSPEQAIAPRTAASAGRKTYRRPRLRHFGLIRDLTMGSGGTMVDGNMVNKR